MTVTYQERFQEMLDRIEGFRQKGITWNDLPAEAVGLGYDISKKDADRMLDILDPLLSKIDIMDLIEEYILQDLSSLFKGMETDIYSVFGCTNLGRRLEKTLKQQGDLTEAINWTDFSKAYNKIYDGGIMAYDLDDPFEAVHSHTCLMVIFYMIK